MLFVTGNCQIPVVFFLFLIFSVLLFLRGGIDVVCLSTLLWVSLSMMLKNALFFSNLEDQH